ncbi:MAG: hypothetical protein KatS3mg112_1892 [Thermogutta sp.]|nr:MAG: hypothetical protein KatS3mg112_1892 [Thermogutta sp.]
MEFLANFLKFRLAGCPLLEIPLLKFQLGSPLEVLRLPLGLLDNPFCLGLGVFAPQVIDQLGDGERQPRNKNANNCQKDKLIGFEHGQRPHFLSGRGP